MSQAIAGYQYPAPTRADFLDALRRVLGADDAPIAWAHACDVARFPPGGPEPRPEQLQQAAQALIQMGGLRSVVGNSMFVRILTYQSLAHRNATARGASHA